MKNSLENFSSTHLFFIVKPPISYYKKADFIVRKPNFDDYISVALTHQSTFPYFIFNFSLQNERTVRHTFVSVFYHQ